jgi:hypothetical protein
VPIAAEMGGTRKFLWQYYYLYRSIAFIVNVIELYNFCNKNKHFVFSRSEISEMPKVVGLQKLKLFRIDGSNITDIPPFSLKNLPGAYDSYVLQ